MLTGTSFPSRQVRPINHNWVTPESLPMVAFLQNGLGQILADSTSFSTLWTKYLSFDSIRPNHRIQSTAEDMTMRKCSYSWNMWQVWNGKKKLHSANVPHTKNEANCHLDYPVTQNCRFFFQKLTRLLHNKNAPFFHFCLLASYCNSGLVTRFLTPSFFAAV